MLLEDVRRTGCLGEVVGFWVVLFSRGTDSGVKLLLKYVANLL